MGVGHSGTMFKVGSAAEAKGKARSPSSALVPTFLGEGSPAKIDYRKKGTLIFTSLLQDLGKV